MNPPDSGATIAWRVGSLEQDLRDERQARRENFKQLDEGKAEAKDVQRLADEFKALRLTLQWFMGITAVAVLAFAGIVVQLIGG
jgi:hypothetical protein